MPEPDQEPVIIQYDFRFSDGAARSFEVRLDPENLQLLERPKTLPEWTRLSYRQCRNCPLASARVERCPAAAGFAEVVEFFGARLSHEMVHVSVSTRNRTYSRDLPLQRGVGPLIGVISATSGCPILGTLRPMVETHLPFPASDESIYRFLSFYLVGQYLKQRRGNEPDWSLRGLVDLASEIEKVNQGLAARLASVCALDGAINSVVVLNAAASWTRLTIESAAFDRLEKLYKEMLG